jgi:hypothetical protein
LRSISVSANLNSSAIGIWLLLVDLDNRDENHPMAVRVNSLWIFTPALGHYPVGRAAPRPHPHLQHSAVPDALLENKAEREARGLVAPLFVVEAWAEPSWRERCAYRPSAPIRAYVFLRASPPHGLELLESGDRI